MRTSADDLYRCLEGVKSLSALTTSVSPEAATELPRREPQVCGLLRTGDAPSIVGLMSRLLGVANGRAGMSMVPTAPLTALLQAWRDGEGAAFAAVFSLAYTELKQIAAQRLRQSGSDLTLTPTILVHEVYLRVVQAPVDFKNRAHFYASMSLYIRSVLVDHARAGRADKRGGGGVRVSLSEIHAGEESMVAEILALDQALVRLEGLDPRASEIMQLTYFAGLDRLQITAVMGVSLASVDRDLRFARAWLRQDLAGGI
jgi:RNA polymerase sigma factor (TIGR02999 family)